MPSSQTSADGLAGGQCGGGRAGPRSPPAGQRPVGTPARRAGRPSRQPSPGRARITHRGCDEAPAIGGPPVRTVARGAAGRRSPRRARERRRGAGAATCVSGTGAATPARSGGVPEGRGRSQRRGRPGDAAGATPAAPAAPSAPAPRRPGRFGSGDYASGDGPRCGGSRGSRGAAAPAAWAARTARGSEGAGPPVDAAASVHVAGCRMAPPQRRAPCEAAPRVRWESVLSVRAGAGAFAHRTAAARLAGRGASAESARFPGLSRRGSHDLDGRIVGRMQKRRMAKDRGAGALRGRPRRSTEPPAAAFFAWRCGRTPVGTTAGLSDEAP